MKPFEVPKKECSFLGNAVRVCPKGKEPQNMPNALIVQISLDFDSATFD